MTAINEPTPPPAYFSWRVFVGVALVLTIVLAIVLGGLLALDGSFRGHLLGRTDKTTVTVVDQDVGSGSCGRRRGPQGTKQQVVWTADGVEQTGWYLACDDFHRVGESFEAWSVPGDRVYDWDARSTLWKYPLGVVLVSGAATLIWGWRSRGLAVRARPAAPSSPPPH